MTTTTSPPIETATQRTSEPSTAPAPPRSRQLSRTVALLVALVAMGVVTYGLTEGVQASRLPRKAVGTALAETRLEASGFAEGGPMVARVLGLVDTSGQVVGRFGNVDRLAIPEEGSFLVMLTRDTGELVGLSLVVAGPAERSPGDVRISPRTTAEALLALAPGVLHRDPAELNARLGILQASPNFEPLVQAIRGSTDLRTPDAFVEEAIVAIIDQTAPSVQLADQGCDSVNNASATPRIGACFVPSTGSGQLLIMNEQSRWILLFSANAEQQVCAVVPPAPGNRLVSSSGACGSTVELAAPGPLDDNDQPVDRARERTELAAALTAFAEYAVPFADLALGASGAMLGLDERVGENPGLIGSQLRAMLDSDPALRQRAGQLVEPDAAPRDRVEAMLVLSRAELNQAALTTALIAGSSSFSPHPEGLALLDMYDRIVQLQTSGANVPVWEADGFEQVDLARLAAGGS